MANLSDETSTTVFNLQRRLLHVINQATATEYNLAEQYGETEATLSELSRLYRLLLQIATFQTLANYATLKLLAQSIEDTQAIADAGEVSIQEIKRNWNLL